MLIKKIITHPGKAHFDEFFAICILFVLADRCIEIERKDPTEEELNDPNIIVVDVGMKLQPELNNYDHHQEKELECAYVQVAKYFGVEDLLSKIRWFYLKSIYDTKGPYEVSKYVMSQLDTHYLNGPLESFMIDRFAKFPNDPAIQDIMRSFGRRAFGQALDFDERFKFYDSCKIEIFNRYKNVIFIPDDSIFGLDEWEINKQKNDKTFDGLDAAVYHDDRGEGWTLLRLNNSGIIDFTKIADEDKNKMKFIHHNGFLAKTHDRVSTDIEFIKKILSQNLA